MSVKIIELIYCDLERRGTGEYPNDPIRRVRQLYGKDGVLFMEDDSEVKFTEKDLGFFAFDLLNAKKKSEKIDTPEFIKNWIAENKPYEQQKDTN